MKQILILLVSDKLVGKNIFRLGYLTDILHIFQICYLLWSLSSSSSLFTFVNTCIFTQFPSFIHQSCLSCSLICHHISFIDVSIISSGQLTAKQLLKMILVANSIILPVSAACAGFYEKCVPMLHISKGCKQSRVAAQSYGYFKYGPESGKSCVALFPLNT